MERSQYARSVPAILAQMQQEREGSTPQRPKIYIYRTEDGDMVATTTPIEPEQPIVASEPPASTPRKAAPPFLLFILALLVFLLLDGLNSQLVSLMTPTAIITLVPQVKTLTLHSTTTLGKLLSPITLSQSLNIPATGHGHQDARAASGQLTFYNGSFSTQTIPLGAIYTGADGIQVATAETVTIPAAQPPQFGEATVTAQTISPGAAGNISAGDINSALSNDLLVKNVTAFTGGQDERNFTIVTAADISKATSIIKPSVEESMKAALSGQLLPGEALSPIPCSPQITTDHHPGDAASSVTVTVAETCSAIAYDSQELLTQATKLLLTQAIKQIGQGYTSYGARQVTVTNATAHQASVLLTFTAKGMWLYHITQEQITALIAGKPRTEALHLLSRISGIRKVNITGIGANDLLPTDQQHMKFIELLGV